MSEWKEYKLGDMAIIVDCEHKTAPIVDYGDFISVRTANILNGKIDFEKSNRVSEETYNEWTKRLAPEEGDIILAREAPVGEVGWISKNRKVCLGQRTVLIRITKKASIAPKYLLYYMVNGDTKYELTSRSTGSVVEHLNVKDIKNLDLKVHKSIQEQTAIASILSSLDDKIDLLQRQNKTLEQLAETLFRQWFVEEAKESWVVGKLDDIAVFSNGRSRPNEVENGDIPIYGGNGILGFTDQSNYEGLSVIIGRVGAYCGSLFIENKPIWLSDNALIARGKKEDYTFYLFYLLKSMELNSMAEGSSHPLLTQTLLKSIDICVPPSQNILDFNKQVSEFWTKIYANQNQIRTLTQTRDTILPKLMSGEVRVRAGLAPDGQWQPQGIAPTIAPAQ